MQRLVGNQTVKQLVQANPNGRPPADGQSAAEVHRLAREGIEGTSGPLPFVQEIQRAFGPAHDLSKVQAHHGEPAAEANAAMNAQAFTMGEHIAFRRPPDLRLAAHEAAHVVQQRGGVQLAEEVGRQGDVYEQHAESVAERVAAGESAADLLSPFETGDHLPSVQRQGDPADAGTPPPSDAGTSTQGTTPDAQAGSVADQVEDALGRVPEGASGGVGDFPAAFSALNGLSMADMLRALEELDRRHQLDVLKAHIAEAGPVNVLRIQAAVQIIWLTRATLGNVTVGDLRQFVAGMSSLPADQRQEVADYLVSRHLGGYDLEGFIAFLDGDRDDLPGESAQTSAHPGPGTAPRPSSSATATAAATTAAGGAGGAGGGGPIFPRGRQPFWYYLGNLAHRLIAGYYQRMHGGQRVHTNYIEMRTLLLEAGNLVGISPNLGHPNVADKLDRRPDITNLSLWHLFEIKSMRLISTATAQANMYVQAFRDAGIMMYLGPSDDPGANGIIPLTFADLRFTSTMPGAIGYRFRMRRRRPQQEQEETETDTSSRALEILAIAGLVVAVVVVAIVAPEVIAALAAEEAVAGGAVVAGGETLAAGETVLAGAEAGEVLLGEGATAGEILFDGAGTAFAIEEMAAIEADVALGETAGEGLMSAAPLP